MANTGYDVGFTIKSDFDGKGIDKAKQGLKDVGQAAQQTANATTQVGNSASQMTGKLKQAASAGAALTAGMGFGSGGLGMVMRSTGAVLGSIALGPLGWLTAGITVAVTAFQYFAKKTEEAKKKVEEFREGIEKNRAAMEKSGVEALANKYDVLTKRINDSITARKRLAQAQGNVDDANKNKDLAEVDATEKDPLIAAQKKAKIEADAAKKKADDNKLAKEQAIKDANELLAVQTKTMADASQKQEELQANERRLNEEMGKAQNDATAPKKTVMDSNSVMGQGGMSQKQIQVVDKEAQKKEVERLKKQLAENDANKMVAAKTYSDAGAKADEINSSFDALEKEKEAAVIEATTVEKRNTESLKKAQQAIDDHNYEMEQRQPILADLKKKEKELADNKQKLIDAEKAEADASKRVKELDDKIKDAKDKQLRAIESGAKGASANGQDARDKAKQTAKDNESEARWAKNAQKKLASGRDLSEKDLGRLNDYNQWQADSRGQGETARKVGNRKDRDVYGNMLKSHDINRGNKLDALGEQDHSSVYEKMLGRNRKQKTGESLEDQKNREMGKKEKAEKDQKDLGGKLDEIKKSMDDLSKALLAANTLS